MPDAPGGLPSRRSDHCPGGLHPGQQISTLYVNSDNTLQNVLTAVRGGSPPGIAYLYGGQHEGGVRFGRGPGLAEHVAADGRAKGRRRG